VDGIENPEFRIQNYGEEVVLSILNSDF
jgi:hypothetical protein